MWSDDGYASRHDLYHNPHLDGSVEGYNECAEEIRDPDLDDRPDKDKPAKWPGWPEHYSTDKGELTAPEMIGELNYASYRAHRTRLDWSVERVQVMFAQFGIAQVKSWERRFLAEFDAKYEIRGRTMEEIEKREI